MKHCQSKFFKIFKSLIFLAIAGWIYFWFCIYWAVPIHVEPYLKISGKCVHTLNGGYALHGDIDYIEFLSPLGICYFISKLIQSPVTLISAIAITAVLIYLLIEHSKRDNLIVFMFLFATPLILTLIIHILIVLLSTNLAE